MTVLFAIISVLGLLAALGTVLSRNLVHAALYLIAFFFVVACQFVLLEAEFLAAVQVLVYIGAVAILLMFGIMLTRNVQGDDTTSVSPGWTYPALVGGLGIFMVLAFGINDTISLEGARQPAWRAEQTRLSVAELERNTRENSPGRARVINSMGAESGREMMTRFAVPFEVAGLLLTAALVGAIALAHRDKDDAEAPRRGVQPTRAHGATVIGQPSGQPSPDDEPVTSNSR